MSEAPELPANLKREAAKTGPCEALTCAYDCDAYVQAGWADGFKICVCGHTQWAHQTVRTEA